MKNCINYMIIIACCVAFSSCKEELIVPIGEGLPSIDITAVPTNAFFGDSISYTVNVADQAIDLSTLKVQLYYSEEVVAEQTIRTKAYGTYSGKIFVPYYANVPNGTATLKFTLQNITLTKTEKEVELPLARPDFPYLTLVTPTVSYRMEKVGLYQYELTENLPFKVNGYIEAPIYGTNGNLVQFGWDVDKVTEGSRQAIPFSNSTSGEYSISFNTFNYHASPFIIGYAVNGNGMRMISEDMYAVDLQLTYNEELMIDGIEELPSWWIDADYIRQEEGDYFFNAMTGKYRITADFGKEYFVIEAMQGNNLATLNNDGTGAVWIIGQGIGKPSLAGNEVGWTTEKALCMAPIGNKRYQITVAAGQTIRASDINFKFFHQKGWGGEFKHTSITGSSDIIFIGDGTNGRDSGNLGLVTGKTLENGATYVFVVDLSAGIDKGVLTVTKQE
ncbi:DUF5125 domain-containing protein [Sphingobacterium alkalisoli]|uniref:DUF5125 domain-containing protein n=1 Tax=Sphingobacterium alkalisoli TaxID=1874115 RepID=A0A4U0GYL1_9SPHI|nr:DUF5125 domain-containing protein [Sphingobacterium alkalisoli]TJY64307.1 DUF5125 domain-containing protein [Sphingobacterium alkalisoli]